MNLTLTINSLLAHTDNFNRRERIIKMISLAIFAFADETRKGEDHYLRHVQEAMDTTAELFGGETEEVRETALITACGHDLIEDKSQMFGGRAALESLIQREFGDEILNYLRLLTNPDFPEGMPENERHELYVVHVREHCLFNRITAGVKLADFASNTGNLERLGSINSEKQMRLARKYLPLFRDFDGIATRGFRHYKLAEILRKHKAFAESLLQV